MAAYWKTILSDLKLTYSTLEQDALQMLLREFAWGKIRVKTGQPKEAQFTLPQVDQTKPANVWA